MGFQITIAGEAGQGIAKSADLVAKDFVSRGWYVFNYREYGSLIRGGENFNILRISTEPVYSNEWASNYAIVFGKFSGHHLKELAPKAVSIGTLDGVENLIDIPALIGELNAPPIVANSILLGSLYKSMGQPLDGLLREMESFGKNAGINQQAARRGYELPIKRSVPVEAAPSKKDMYFVSGSQAIAMGAVAAGMDMYIAYPMTPATPVLHIIANLDKYDVRSIQLENEIGVVNASIGANFAGAKTMIGTSGGGFALMNEALSLQGVSEVPLVVYLCMRPGPATGVPTYTGQGDVKFAVNAGHGEFSRAVVAPGDPLEAFERTAEAFYLANKYRILSVILTDKHLAESNYTLDQKPKISAPKRFLVEGGPNYLSYKISNDGMSPRAPLGKGVVRATSYEHDEMGYTVEESKPINAMIEKRLAKAKTFEKAVMALKPTKLYGKGERLIISWGSTKGAILDAMKHVDNTRFLQLYYLSPLPSKIIKKEIEASSDVVLVENSATGQMANIIKEGTGITIDKKILKYDGRPFGFIELAKRLKGVLK